MQAAAASSSISPVIPSLVPPQTAQTASEPVSASHKVLVVAREIIASLSQPVAASPIVAELELSQRDIDRIQADLQDRKGELFSFADVSQKSFVHRDYPSLLVEDCFPAQAAKDIVDHTVRAKRLIEENGFSHLRPIPVRQFLINDWFTSFVAFANVRELSSLEHQELFTSLLVHMEDSPTSPFVDNFKEAIAQCIEFIHEGGKVDEVVISRDGTFYIGSHAAEKGMHSRLYSCKTHEEFLGTLQLSMLIEEVDHVARPNIEAGIFSHWKSPSESHSECMRDICQAERQALREYYRRNWTLATPPEPRLGPIALTGSKLHMAKEIFAEVSAHYVRNAQVNAPSWLLSRDRCVDFSPVRRLTAQDLENCTQFEATLQKIYASLLVEEEIGSVDRRVFTRNCQSSVLKMKSMAQEIMKKRVSMPSLSQEDMQEVLTVLKEAGVVVSWAKYPYNTGKQSHSRSLESLRIYY